MSSRPAAHLLVAAPSSRDRALLPVLNDAVTFADPSTTTIGDGWQAKGQRPGVPKDLGIITGSAGSRMVRPLGLAEKEKRLGQGKGESYVTQGLSGNCPGRKSEVVTVQGTGKAHGITESGALNAAIQAALVELKSAAAVAERNFASANICRGRNCRYKRIMVDCNQNVTSEPLGTASCGAVSGDYDNATGYHYVVAVCDRRISMTSTCSCPWIVWRESPL